MPNAMNWQKETIKFEIYLIVNLRNRALYKIHYNCIAS